MTTETIERPIVDAPPATPKRSKKGADVPASPSSFALTIGQPALKEALSVVARAAAGDRAMPILRYVRLIATTDNGGRLALACTDLEIGLMTSVEATVETPGSFCAPAALLANWVATLPNQPISISVDAVTATLHAECGRAKAAIKGSGIDEYPNLTEPADAPLLALPAATLRRALALTAFAANPDASVGVLSCVHLEADGLYALRTETADGLRLTSLKDHFESGVVPFSILLPGKGAAAVSRLLDGAEGDAELWLKPDATSPNVLILRAGDTTLTARLSEGQYPDIQRVIPGHGKAQIAVGRTSLLGALRQSMLFAEPKTNKDGKTTFQTILLAPSGEGQLSGLTIAAEGSERGNGVSDVFATVTGEPADVHRFGVNGPFLRQVLEAMTGDEVMLHLNGPLNPILLTDTTIADYKAVIMPIRVPGLE